MKLVRGLTVRMRHGIWCTLVLMAALLWLACPIAAQAQEEDQLVQLRTERTTTEAYWSDEWLSLNSSQYNHRLATTGAMLASAAYDSEAAVSSLAALGFDESAIEAYLPQTDQEYGNDADQVGYVFAAKKPQGKQSVLVVVLLRGTQNGMEWESDFNVANTTRPNTVHEGFKRAEEGVRIKLARYLANQGIDARNARFLVVGHSRGAAVANLLGFDLDMGVLPGACEEHAYVYTYATPNVATGITTRCSNIFNIINPEDTICRTPLRTWGYGRYGITLALPSSSTSHGDTYEDQLRRMRPRFEELYGKRYTPYSDGVRTAEALEEAMADLAPTVDDYYAQDAQGDSMAAIFKLLARFLGGDERKGSDLAEVLARVYQHDPEFVRAVTEAYLSSPVSSTTKVLHVKTAFVHAHTAECYIAWLGALDASELAPTDQDTSAQVELPDEQADDDDVEVGDEAADEDVSPSLSIGISDLLARMGLWG